MIKMKERCRNSYVSRSVGILKSQMVEDCICNVSVLFGEGNRKRIEYF